MSNEQNWRTDVDAQTYFGSQKKTLAVADRRPVPRNAADLGLGPGIGSSATTLENFNDLLATYNGYYSAPIGIYNAPNATESFVGFVVMDSAIGGVQTFTGMGTGSKLGDTYRRRFIRNPSDPDSIIWGTWEGLNRKPFARMLAAGAQWVLNSAGTVTMPMPTITTVDTDVFSRTATAINILRPGVYSGEIVISANFESGNPMRVVVPDGTGTRNFDRYGTAATGIVTFPFHFRMTSSSGTITATYTIAANSAFGNVADFSIARLGDA